MDSLPDQIGVNEVREFFGRLEKEAAANEGKLLDVARRITAEEEALDDLFLKLDDLDTDCGRTQYSSDSSRTTLSLLKHRNDEISLEIDGAEAQLPLLSAHVSRSVEIPGESLDPQEIFRHLELLCHRHAFLTENMRRIQQRTDPREGGASMLAREGSYDSPQRSSRPTERQPVDGILLNISEGKVSLEKLESELAELEDKLDVMNAVSLARKT